LLQQRFEDLKRRLRAEGLFDEDRTVVRRLSGRTDQVGYLARSLEFMHQSIEARLVELSTLLETSATVVSILDPQRVLERILEQVEALLKTKMVAIVALDEQAGIFRYQASRGLSASYTERVAIDPNELHSVTIRAVNSGGAVQISDTETNPSYRAFRAHAQAAGYRAVMAVPLKTQHAPKAALLVYHPTPHVLYRAVHLPLFVRENTKNCAS